MALIVVVVIVLVNYYRSRSTAHELYSIVLRNRIILKVYTCCRPPLYTTCTPVFDLRLRDKRVFCLRRFSFLFFIANRATH